MNQNGMSRVITTIIFIFVALVGVLIVWSVVVSLADNSSKKIDQNSGFINDSNVKKNISNNQTGNTTNTGNNTQNNTQNTNNTNNTNNSTNNFSNADYALKTLSFNSGKVYLFESSIQFRPWTQKSVNLYANFTDHRVTRLPNIWYNLFTSTSEKDFMTKLGNNNLVKNDYLRQHTDKIIIPVHGLPKWLTGYDLEGYPPKNYTQWNAVVKNLTIYFSQFQGAEIYYEISNEPDLPEFWKGTTDQWLEFYNNTATTIKQIDPSAKVGGAAANQFDGKIEDNREPVNIELIRYVKTNNVPMDFISWHNYHLIDKIDEAKRYYETELGSKNVEFIISEWNGPSSSDRCSNSNPALTADSFLGFVNFGIDEQVFYTTQDDSPNDPLCYGLITQSDQIRPVFYVYSAFNNVSRTSNGIYYQINGENKTIISKNKNGCYDVFVWSLTGTDNTRNYNLSFDSNVKNVSRSSVKDSFNNNDVVSFAGNEITFASEDDEFNDLGVCFL